jgi:prepilin-type N-terminal cleavage/methylation domain-containing protein/prepilin-type processing-associated H-X9-DG protein
MRFGVRRHGFTLIELLVVIAIIAILASILFPVFSRARAKARQTACLSNIKQLDMSIHMYTQDFDESFPFTYGVGVGHYNPAQYQWYDAIQEYKRNWEIDICPEIKTVVPGYGMNSLLSGASIGLMYDSAKKIVLIDFCPNGTPGNHGECEVDGTLGVAQPSLDNQYAKRHNGGYNIAYGDGHAKFALPGGLQDAVYWNPAQP